jgi:DNA-binding HxlR family transcriptional regulator
MKTMSRTVQRTDSGRATTLACCPLYHEAVELIGRRWTGAIVEVLLQSDEPLRFNEIAHAVPQLSDRMLSERLRELETRGVVVREVDAGPPVRVAYALTSMGRGLGPALAALKEWAQTYLPAESSSARAN